MSKQYNLSTTEDNGQSVTTSQTVTEHPEEILRLMKLAGLENAQVVAEDDSVFEPTPANDKLDLDDYSKKSPESIAKQKKTIQPTLGDNPLEYSLDENEIYEAMMEEFDESEEVNEELTAGQKKLPAGLQKAILAKQGKKDEAVEETDEESTEEVADIQEGVGLSGGTSTPYDNYDDRVQRLARIKDRKTGNMSTKDMIDAGIPVHQQKVVHVSTDDDDSSNNPYKDEKGPVKMRKAVLTNDFDESKLRGEDLERLKKLAGIQEDGSEMNPSRLPHPDIDPGDQSFDWPEDGPKIDIDNMEKMPKVTVKGPKNYDDRIQRLARAKDKANPKEPLSLKAYLNF